MSNNQGITRNDEFGFYAIVNDEGQYEIFKTTWEAIEAARNNDEQSWTIVYVQTTVVHVRELAVIKHNN